MSRYALTFGCAFMLFLINATAMPVSQAQQTLVTVDPVMRQNFTNTIPILGRLVTVQAGSVAAQIAGAVREIHVRVGDRVKQRQTIVTISDRSARLRKQLLEVQRKEVEARIAVVEAQLKLAKQEVNRLSKLATSAAISQSQIDDAIQQQNIVSARVLEAKAALNSADAQIKLIDLELAYTRVIAPYDGTVIEKFTEVGSYLQQGQPVIRLVADGDLELEADVPADRLGGLTAGRVVQISFDDGSQHQANVRAIVPEENPRTRTRRVRFSLDLADDPMALAVDQGVTVFIPAGAEREIRSVHKDAVIHGGQGSIVYVVEEGFAKLRPVQLGSSIGNRLEVIQGLAEGDLVVIRGNERLRPDQPVSFGENSS
ncbi:MAG: efflux RND transporter periplasmic adaptor subunit [Gammaproteobacteria bacterium]|nr:efflux RND transporter periplasmic adaptor subunit [Gammaproteobacteria bacterium]MCY4217709.1 efflux RND transporter periplasmic adaptor subunit [Gammaproteobacteria bacterium]MCY4274116.1 efflux RND transporter periplasmic adaptor subunit [Gammaproteobacteria bacterium]